VNRKAPVALTIAGSDNSGGAGIQADLKTFTRLGVYGTSALTCIVAEHPGRVSRITAVEPRMVAEQIKLVFEAFPVGAVKTGMLFSSKIIEQVAKQLGKRRGLEAGGGSCDGGDERGGIAQARRGAGDGQVFVSQSNSCDSESG